jgi:hypothetical protein
MLDTIADKYSVKKGQIQDKFRTCLAFVRNIDKTCGRPVTREDGLKRQRWDLQAIEQYRLRRKEKAAAAAAAAASDDDEKDEEEEEEEDKSSSSSISSDDEEEEVEAHKGVAHEGQLTTPAQIL